MTDEGEPAAYRVTISPRAQREIREIHDFVRVDSPQNADSLVDRLLIAVSGLARFPQRYRPPRSRALRQRDVRSMPVLKFLVYYRIDEAEKLVRVTSVQHGARRQRR